ncbi:hypothetical protein [Aliarcobacter butzleri]|uniref:hypothetical protein n=1 Tax=Aliarcobacter butzleri TaxID=28197 RepID=UPI00263F46F4|nr:hypothetical protein [Aliarcobacter butzleri]MDN5093398.1 hypothetical protein [Aliarcobacter butzleri]
MRRAERVYNLFLELEKYKDFRLIDFWERYFNTKDRRYIYKYLGNLYKEVYLLENDMKEIKLEKNSQFKMILSFLKTLLEYSDLTKEIKSTSLMNNITSIKSFFEIVTNIYHSKNLIDENEIPLVDLDNFKNMLEEEIKNLKDSDLTIEDKDFFLSLFEDFDEAIAMYKISGLDSFNSSIKKNLCKLKVIDEDIKENDKFQPYIKASKKILGTTFSWIIQYGKKKANNILDHKITKFIENKIEEWKNIDKPSSDSDDTIDAELED